VNSDGRQMNTKKSLGLIEQALQALPANFALRDVRFHVIKALNELRKVENKKNKQKTAQETTPLEKWRFDLETSSMMAPWQTKEEKKNTILNIDKMIEIEQKKLEPDDGTPDLFTG